MSLVDPRATFFAEETQRLANRLPQYHAGRRLRTSNWSRVVNDLQGITLADIHTQLDRSLRNKYLTTAHLDEPDLIRVADLPQGLDLTPPENTVNLLKNASFETRARPNLVADYWSHVGAVSMEAPAFFGMISATLRPTLGTTASISQTITTDSWSANVPRSFSAWYRIATWAGGTIPSTSHGLLVTVTYTNGSTQVFRAALASDTADQWRRVTLTVQPPNTVALYTVSVETQRSAAFGLTVPVRVDALQAEVGAVATTWRPHLEDRPNWLPTTYRTPVGFEAEVPIFVTDSLRHFAYEAVPTRTLLVKTDSVDSGTDNGGGFNQAVDYFKETWNYRWDIDTANNKIRKIGIEPQDIYASFDLSFFTGTTDGPKFEEGVTGQTYHCVTQFGRWLYVIHQTVDIYGAAVIALSIVDPQVPYPSPSYLESKQTLVTALPVGPSYHKVRIRFEDPQHCYVSTSTVEYRLRLFYDYALIDERALRTFFREPYETLALLTGVKT